MNISDLNKDVHAIAFLWDFNVTDEPKLDIEIAEIVSVSENYVTVSWLIGWKHKIANISMKDIVAIISKKGTEGERFKISGWSGRVIQVLNQSAWDSSVVYELKK